MSIDLSKLTPAPWTATNELYDGLWGVVGSDNWLYVGVSCHPDSGKATDEQIHEEAAAKFIALARNAFDGDPEALAWWEKNRRRR